MCVVVVVVVVCVLCVWYNVTIIICCIVSTMVSMPTSLELIIIVCNGVCCSAVL